MPPEFLMDEIEKGGYMFLVLMAQIRPLSSLTLKINLLPSPIGRGYLSSNISTTLGK